MCDSTVTSPTFTDSIAEIPQNSVLKYCLWSVRSREYTSAKTCVDVGVAFYGYVSGKVETSVPGSALRNVNITATVVTDTGSVTMHTLSSASGTYSFAIQLASITSASTTVYLVPSYQNHIFECENPSDPRCTNALDVSESNPFKATVSVDHKQAATVNFVDRSVWTVSGHVTYSSTAGYNSGDLPCSAANITVCPKERGTEIPKGECVTTDSQGRYAVSVEHGASVDLVPNYKEHSFSPPRSTFESVDRDFVDQNFENTHKNTLVLAYTGCQRTKAIGEATFKLTAPHHCTFDQWVVTAGMNTPVQVPPVQFVAKLESATTDVPGVADFLTALNLRSQEVDMRSDAITGYMRVFTFMRT